MLDENYTNITLNWTDGRNIVIFDNIFVTCSEMSIFLNAFVLLIAFIKVNFKVRLVQLFVVNMTIADFIFSLAVVITTIGKYFSFLRQWYCRPFYSLLWSSSMVSVLFLLLVNIHKFVTLFYPLRSKIFLLQNRVLMQILCCWLLTLIVTTVNLSESILNVRLDKDFSCIVSINPTFYICKIIIFYILPLVLSLITSTAIFILVQKKVRKSNDRSRENRKLWKRIVFVFTCTFWTGITCLPFRIINVNFHICRHSVFSSNSTNYHLDTVSRYNRTSFLNTTVDLNKTWNDSGPEYYCLLETTKLLNIFRTVMIFGTVVNPILTIITQKKYKNGMKELCYILFNFLCCKQKDILDNICNLSILK